MAYWVVLVEVDDFIFDFFIPSFFMSLLAFFRLPPVVLPEMVEPLVVPVCMSLAGWVLLLGSVPNELFGCAGGDDWGLAVPFTVGVVPVAGEVVWAAAAVMLNEQTVAKASNVFIGGVLLGKSKDGQVR
ncbi:hypothetical protein BXP70_03400 [Hymenobacter crusticola]|uniref:Uncharacterized protein n=1 Tax=Hymenobacter crusticola TaxID=1770526 RepID=A0A243WGY4_9BACT|nr:hypothetical protein BXP70_03400 [Hymenobacter crusticola]